MNELAIARRLLSLSPHESYTVLHTLITQRPIDQRDFGSSVRLLRSSLVPPGSPDPRRQSPTTVLRVMPVVARNVRQSRCD